ncbi:amidohydrolase family protein [Thiohalorhabdus sp. Cl-TMA]|uniref:Amidohydrolase family protein n=2 Tax=Thiohalorhabdus methylotrophus TaxID=3242694 RepID=A0ABV4TX81_9GAMM
MAAAEPQPVADVHLHYNWDHEEVTPPEVAAEKLARNKVAFGVVSGVPAARALKLKEAASMPVIAFFSPYIHHRGRLDWHRDERVLKRTRAALASGRFHGIGEVHFVASIGPPWSNPVFQGLLDLAREFEVPVLVHAEASDHRYFLPVCRSNPGVRFQWAHAGARMGPEAVGALMEACPNVWTELSARDPWRYGRFAAEDGSLPEAWRRLFERFPERFMIGSDPVWPPGMVFRWDTADTGWRRFEQFLDYHRRWLRALPQDLARKIRLTNAQRFFAYALSEPRNQ